MRKQLILTLALFMAVFSFAQKKELKKLEKAVKNNNYAEAKALVTQLEPVLESMDDKTKAKYYFNKAKAFYANGTGTNADFKLALNDLSKVDEKYVKELPTIKKALQNEFLTKANELYKGNKFKEAAVLFEMLYELVPSDQAYLYYAAVSAISAQDYDLALKHYLQLKDLGYTGVDTQYYATNKDTGAEEILDKATRDIYVNRLKTHISPGERKTESKTAEITKNIALIYLNQGKNDEALAAIKDARKANPEDTALIITEANTQFKLGNKEAYTSLIKEATAKDPNNKDLLFNLGVLSAESGNDEEARAYYEKALKIDPNYVNALTNLAALILSGESALIEEMNNLGSSAKDNRRYDELKEQRSQIYKDAIPYLETVLKVTENNVDVARTLMNIYNAIDDSTKAKALKEKYGL